MKHVFTFALLCTLILTACLDKKSAAQEPVTIQNKTWVAKDIDGKGIIDNARLTLALSDDGKLSGNGGCNMIMGQAQLENEKIQIGPLMSTKRACAAAALNQQESAYTQALEKARAWHLDNGILYLNDAGGTPILRFSSE